MIEPMLARKTELSSINFRFQPERLVQPKLRGIRAIWNPQKQTLNTRNGRPITSVPHIVKAISECALKDHPLDGEIYTAALPFDKINGLARREKAIEDSCLLEFHCFDIVIDGLKNKDRDTLRLNMKFIGPLKKVESRIVKSNAELSHKYTEYLLAGYEGIIIRDPDADYMQGLDGDWMFKVKPEYDMEATLIGFESSESGSKNKESFGSLILQGDNGQVFKCSGLTDHDRRTLWHQEPFGERITVAYDALSKKGVPISPRYRGIRWDV